MTDKTILSFDIEPATDSEGRARASITDIIVTAEAERANRDTGEVFTSGQQIQFKLACEAFNGGYFDMYMWIKPRISRKKRDDQYSELVTLLLNTDLIKPDDLTNDENYKALQSRVADIEAALFDLVGADIRFIPRTNKRDMWEPDPRTVQLVEESESE